MDAFPSLVGKGSSDGTSAGIKASLSAAQARKRDVTLPMYISGYMQTLYF